jgi:hypothetical protein
METSSLPGMVSTPEKTTTTPTSVSKPVQGSSVQVTFPYFGTMTCGSSPSAEDDSENDNDDGRGGTERYDSAAYDDQDLSTLDFSGSFQELDFHRFHRIMWMVILAIAGFLDIAASASTILRPYVDCADRLDTLLSRKGGKHSHFTLDGGAFGSSFCHDIWTPFIVWLEGHNVTISFMFSLLWFRLAFLKARDLRNAALVKKDRSCLLSDDAAKTNANPQVVYIRRIWMELALLPVGFYILLYHFGKGFFSEGKSWSQAFVETPDGVQESFVLTITDQEYGVEYEVFNEQSKISLLGAAILHFYRTIMAATIFARAAFMEYITRSAIPTLIRKLLQNAVRNPIRFNRQLRNALTYLRWIKYIVPL